MGEQDFRGAYRAAVRDIAPLLTRDRLVAISRHNLGLHPDNYNMHDYLRLSERRYANAVDLFGRDISGVSVLDVGGFLGAFPLALARLGAKVTLAEEFGYYDGALDDLVALLKAEGVRIWNADFTGTVDARGSFDVVMNLAMIEHLPSSPRRLMSNLRSVMGDDGVLLLEMPNIAYWPNRLKALRGQSIHQSYRFYLDTDPPFLGHHREYTVAEVYELLAQTGFTVREVRTLNYSAEGWSLRLLSWFWPAYVFPGCRELILVSATRR